MSEAMTASTGTFVNKFKVGMFLKSDLLLTHPLLSMKITPPTGKLLCDERTDALAALILLTQQYLHLDLKSGFLILLVKFVNKIY